MCIRDRFWPGELQYVVHVAVVIIQQVEFQFLGPGCTIVEGQRIEIACSIYTEEMCIRDSSSFLLLIF